MCVRGHMLALYNSVSVCLGAWLFLQNGVQNGVAFSLAVGSLTARAHICQSIPNSL